MYTKRKAKAESLNDKTLIEVRYSTPLVVGILIALSVFLLILCLATYRSIVYPIISIIAVLPLIVRTAKGKIKIKDNQIIVKDWWYVGINKTYKFDTVANVSLYSFLDLNWIILEINQGNHQNIKRIPILFVKNVNVVYLKLKNLVNSVKNDKDVLTELIDENNYYVKQIATILNDNNASNSKSQNSAQ